MQNSSSKKCRMIGFSDECAPHLYDSEPGLFHLSSRSDQPRDYKTGDGLEWECGSDIGIITAWKMNISQ